MVLCTLVRPRQSENALTHGVGWTQILWARSADRCQVGGSAELLRVEGHGRQREKHGKTMTYDEGQDT